MPAHIHDDDGTVEGCPGCFAEPKSPRTLIAENLASLNEIIAELVVHVADPEESEFVELVRNTLRDHSWSIGMAFQGERPPADWVAQLEAQHSAPLPSTYYDEDSRAYHRRPAPEGT